MISRDSQASMPVSLSSLMAIPQVAVQNLATARQLAARRIERDDFHIRSLSVFDPRQSKCRSLRNKRSDFVATHAPETHNASNERCHVRSGRRDAVDQRRAGRCTELSVVRAEGRRCGQLRFCQLRAMPDGGELVQSQSHVPTAGQGAASPDGRTSRLIAAANSDIREGNT
jgi:hypothetical protein